MGAMFGAIALFAGATSASGGQWTENVAIPGTGPGTAELRTIETPDRGTFAYWLRDVGGDRIVQSTKIGPEGSTGPVQSLSAPGQDAKDPVAAVAPNGNATVAWVRSNGTNDVIQSVAVSQGGSVGTVANRSAAGNLFQNAEQPAIAVAPNGTVALAWRRFNAPLWVAQAMVIPDGGAASAVRDVSTVPIAVNRIPPEGSPSDHKGIPVDPIANAGSLDIAAVPDNGFRMVWVRQAGDLTNVLTTTLAPDGTPGEASPLFVDRFGWFEEKVTGDPQGVRITSNRAGQSMIIWSRFLISTKPDPVTNEEVLVGIQRGAELIALGPTWQAVVPPGTPQQPLLVSPYWANISEIEPGTGPSDHSTVTWYSDLFGVKKSQYAALSPGTKMGGSLDLPSSLLGEFTHPSGGVGPGRWGTVAWYEQTLVSGINQAHVYNITANSVVTGVKDLSGTTLKSSEQPQVTVDDLGVPTVVFYGVDMDDNGSLWFTRYSNPGISVTPANIQFDGGLLNVVSSPRSITIISAGTTSNTVTGIGLVGPGAEDFRIQNRDECMGQKVAKVPCELKVAFSPSQAGPTPPVHVQIDSVAGSFSTSLSGKGVARTRLDLKVRPRRITVNPGRKLRIKATVKNTGGITAKGARVCFFANKRSFSPRKACGTIGSLAAGDSRVVQYLPRVRRNAIRGRTLPVSVKLKVDNANHRRSTAFVKVKPRR